MFHTLCHSEQQRWRRRSRRSTARPSAERTYYLESGWQRQGIPVRPAREAHQDSRRPQALSDLRILRGTKGLPSIQHYFFHAFVEKKKTSVVRTETHLSETTSTNILEWSLGSWRMRSGCLAILMITYALPDLPTLDK
jgi:hypothetical protein